MKKRVLLLMISAVVLLAGCGGGDENVSQADVPVITQSEGDPQGEEVGSGENFKSDEKTEIPAEKPPFVCDEAHVRQLGRTWLDDEGILWCAMSASGAEFEFSGESLDIALMGGEASVSGFDRAFARFAVYVDGERVIDDVLDYDTKQVEVLRGNTSPRTVKVVKLSESKHSVMGIMPLIADDGARVSPAPEKALTIEFVGDSLTCGYGIDDDDPTHKFSTATEDVTKAFACKTAEKLDADISIFALSGWGVVSGYSGGEKAADTVIPPYYGTVGWSKDTFLGTGPDEIGYAGCDADIVVVNLGTNDKNYLQASGAEGEFIEEYAALIRKIREQNPRAKIVLTSGMMDDCLDRLIASAQDIYTEESADTQVYRFCFTPMDWGDMTAPDWHPNEDYSERAADELAQFLRTII